MYTLTQKVSVIFPVCGYNTGTYLYVIPTPISDAWHLAVRIVRESGGSENLAICRKAWYDAPHSREDSLMPDIFTLVLMNKN